MKIAETARQQAEVTIDNTDENVASDQTIPRLMT